VPNDDAPCCRLAVTVTNQTFAPECPDTGTFEVSFFANQTQQWQKCLMAYLKLNHEPNGTLSNQPGVQTTLEFEGSPQSVSWPVQDLLLKFRSEGYEPGRNLFFACWDIRLGPYDVVVGER
jgi:hypothetical protein